MSKTLQQQLVSEAALIPYKILLILLFPYLLLLTIRKVFQGGGFQYFIQRFGFNLAKCKKPIWFHGASVGEINSLLPLVKAYIKKYPKHNVLVTCNTPTAYSILEKQTLPNFHFCYLPIDLAGPVDSFVLLVNPVKAIIFETELWPNLFAACVRNKTQIIIINGRISNKTLKSNLVIKKAYRFCMTHINKIYCRTKKDKKGFETLGADPNKVFFLGNIKYNFIPTSSNNPIPRNFALLASSHNGEEAKITQMWQNNILSKTHLLVITPRHPERSKNIVKQLKALGVSIAIRSKKQEITENTQVYLADTIGEMPIWYEHTDLVIMGGSFIKHGGQNFIEPAGFGKVIITGPYTHNFAEDVTLFLKKQALIQVKNINELSEKITSFASTPSIFCSTEKNAKRLIEQNKGIIEKYLNKIG